MNETFRVVSTSFGTSDWRVERTDGTYVCDIRIELSTGYYGSRYFVLREGRLQDEGSFTYDTWDDAAARNVVTAVLRKKYPDATVLVEPRAQRRAASM